MKAKQEQKAEEQAAAGACRQSGEPPPAAGRSPSSSFPLQALKQPRRFRADDFLVDKTLPRRDTRACFTRAEPRERLVNLPALPGANTAPLLTSSSPAPRSPAGRLSPNLLTSSQTCLPAVPTSRGAEKAQRERHPVIWEHPRRGRQRAALQALL